MRSLDGIDVPTVTDGRITLRPLREDDLGELLPAVHDPDVLRWCVSIPDPYTDDDGRAFLTRCATARVADGDVPLAIVDAQTDELLGVGGFNAIDPDDEIAELGYWVKRDARRRGVAAAMLRLVVAWGFEVLGLSRISVTVHVDNRPSQRMVESVGFVREGVLRSYVANQRGERGDYVMYSLLPDDPR